MIIAEQTEHLMFQTLENSERLVTEPYVAALWLVSFKQKLLWFIQIDCGVWFENSALDYNRQAPGATLDVYLTISFDTTKAVDSLPDNALDNLLDGNIIA